LKRGWLALLLAAITLFLPQAAQADEAEPLARFAPCSTVTWTYDDTQQPANAARFKIDLQASLELLAQETGLTFVEMSDESSADIRYAFASITSAGMSMGDGSVLFSTHDAWVSDTRAGFSAFRPFKQGKKRYLIGPAGRGWLIVHETMHVLGLPHVNDPKSIMASVNRGQGAFTTQDRAALRALYSCEKR
jgi:hypothetical protein